MKRNLTLLAGNEYDLLIIGAGIYGACAAWEAASRGLRVAIVDRGDFGAGTSQNSLKIIHGGLRYLQQADLIRMRESIRERRILSRIAPHLVHPLKCVMPTYGHFTKGRAALAVALFLNDIISFDRNRLSDPSRHLPRGKTISPNALRELLPGVPQEGLTGGAVWYDCQTHNSERLLLSFLLVAAEAGAACCNYTEVEGFIKDKGNVAGARVRDQLTGTTHDIRAKLTLNAAGPWVNKVLSLIDDGTVQVPLRLSSAMNLVTRKFIDGHAAGISSRQGLIEEDVFLRPVVATKSQDPPVRQHDGNPKSQEASRNACIHPTQIPESASSNALTRKGSRLYFVAPWRHVSLAGTAHLPYDGDPDDYRVSERDIADFLSEINGACPAAQLTRGDVHFFYGGLLPMKGISGKTGDVTLLKHYRIVDHEHADNLPGLMTVVGVKYTTARDVAVKVIDRVMKKLRFPRVMSLSEEIPVYGGEISRFDDFLHEMVCNRPPSLSEESAAHLAYHYGSRCGDILKYTRNDPRRGTPLPGQPWVLEAEVLHAVREEMAVHLTDAVMRRTELGSAGCPSDECLAACAKIMGEELAWDEKKKEREIELVKKSYIPAQSS